MVDDVPSLADLITEAKQQTNPQALECWLAKNIPALYATHPDEDVRTACPKVKRIRLDLLWDECVSNMHSAPRGKKTNWGRKPDLPSGYPGWTGYLHCEVYERADRTHLSKVLRELDIFTGTGAQYYGFDVRFYADDWEWMAVASALERSGSTSAPAR